MNPIPPPPYYYPVYVPSPLLQNYSILKPPPRISVIPTIYYNSPTTITHSQLTFNPKSINLSQPITYNYKPSSSRLSLSQ